MAESNQNLVNSIGDPKGRVSVKLQPNRYAKEPSKIFFGRTVRNTHTVVKTAVVTSGWPWTYDTITCGDKTLSFMKGNSSYSALQYGGENATITGAAFDSAGNLYVQLYNLNNSTYIKVCSFNTTDGYAYKNKSYS